MLKWRTEGFIQLGMGRVPRYYLVCPDAKTADDPKHELVEVKVWETVGRADLGGRAELMECACGRQFSPAEARRMEII